MKAFHERVQTLEDIVIADDEDRMMSKTALELSPQEWQRYHPADMIERRKRQGAAYVQQRKQRAWQLAQQAAQILRNNFGAQKVAVIGSLAHEAWFTPWSDIDLVVWGIPPERFYAAVGAVAELSTEFTIDLIDAETVRSNLRETIEREGREL